MKSKEDVKGLTALEKLRHKNRMKEIKAETDGRIGVEKLKHDLKMQQQRIKTAEIKRAIDRKAQHQDFRRTYPQ